MSHILIFGINCYCLPSQSLFSPFSYQFLLSADRPIYHFVGVASYLLTDTVVGERRSSVAFERGCKAVKKVIA